MITEVYIEGQRLDLYEDESITVKQVSKDIKDISKIYADYSQSFNVPASNNNNNIFKHYYNANIDGGYDARTRKPANIVVGGLDFKWGKMRMDSVDIKNNVPAAYKITFFGNTIKIKDLIGDDKLFDLDWLSNFDHDFNGTQVKTGLTTGLDFTVDSVSYPAAIIYPLISYRKQYFYNSSPASVINTDTLVNICHHTASQPNGVDYRDLKPAIKLYVIVKAIEEQYGFNFNSPFFDSDTFRKIYMNLNKQVESLANGYILVEDVSGASVLPLGNIPLQWRYKVSITPLAGFESVPYKRYLTLNGTLIWEDPNYVTGTITSMATTDQNLFLDQYDAQLEVRTEQDFEFDCVTELYRQSIFTSETLFVNTYLGNVIDIRAQILDNLQDIKVFDFLSALFKTFNLVAFADGDDIFVQDLQSWYTDGRIFDVTPYIETKTETVNRGDIFKQINYNFENSEQILSDEYKQSNNQGYGNLDFLLVGADGLPLQDVDGETLEVKTIFENPIYERLSDLDNNTLTTIQYGLYTNRQIEPIVGKPFLFFANKPSITSNPIGFLDESSEIEITAPIFMPFHSEFTTSSFNLNFNSEISEYTGQVMPDTIYNRYWSDYIGDMFSIKRRNYEFEGILPVNLLNNLKLNDRLIIKGNRYIINSISSNIVKRKDTLELINDIYDAPLVSDELNTSLFRQQSQIFSNEESDYSVMYVGVFDATITKVDLGDGTTWVTIPLPKTQSTNTSIGFTVDENLSALDRSMGIRVNDGINNPIFVILQNA